MNPICLQIGNHAIYWYGVLMALAFAAGILNWWSLGRREGRDAAFASDLGFWFMVAGILGARIAYVIADWSYFQNHLMEIPRIDKGGLIFYGGFIGALIAFGLIARLRREKSLALADFAITSLPLGHFFGRIGCFLNSCCYGAASSLPWATPVEGVNRHPVQLYEAGCNLFLFFALRHLYLRRVLPGMVMAWYLISYPCLRFMLEFLRGDARVSWGGLAVAQWLSLVLFLAGITLRSGIRRCHAQPTP